MKQTRKKLPAVRQLIGSTDRIDFPDFGLADVAAKVDTGAYTSALHCTDVQLVPTGDRHQLRFTIVAGPANQRRRLSADIFKYKTIKNSFGQSEKRFVVQTRVRILGRTIRAEFSLADRGRMRFPVLLGRKLLRNKFVVDVSLKDVSYKLKNRASDPLGGHQP